MRQSENRSSNLSRIAVIFFALFSAALAQAETCEKFVRGYTTYDELVESKVVEKYKVHEIKPWSANAMFEGFVATSDVPEKNEVVIEVMPEKGKKPLKTTKSTFDQVWKLNSKYKVSNLDPEKAIGFDKKADHFLLKLSSDGKVLCEQKIEINPEH